MERMPENGEIIPQGDERKLLARFYKQAEQNNFRSQAEGRPIFDEFVWVSILIPGDKNTKIERRMTEEDKARFPLAWRRYQQAETVSEVGTPIEQWPRVSVSQVAELKYMNITTVEQLADLSDAICQKMMGLVQLRTEAKAYITAAKDGAHAQNLAAELAKRDEQIERLNEQVAELGRMLEKATDPGTKRSAKAAA